MNRFRRRSAMLLLTWLILGSFIAIARFPPAAAQGPARARLILRTKSAADHAALRDQILQAGGALTLDRPDLNLMAGTVPESSRAQIGASPHALGVASDGFATLEEESPPRASTAPQRTRIRIPGTASPTNAPSAATSVTLDPTFTAMGLMWNFNRIQANKSIQQTVGMGEPYIQVGIVDTGIDYTHIELVNKVFQTVDFTVNENPPICPGQGFPTDTQLKTAFGAPGSDIDFHGHGTWVAGNIAARINMTGTNGIAPQITLISLKVAQNCGIAYDSSIISAILYGADNGVDIMNISFSHYLNRNIVSDDTIYQAYAQAVSYANSKGRVVVAGAGDEHARIGAGGLVIGHGTLGPSPGGVDNFALWQVPGGIPGVVDVSATANLVNSPSATCPADSQAAGTHGWCKLSSEAHQPKGAGLQNQLAEYSNYGPRIDLAGPGGARKFNLPPMDRGGTEGWPWTGINSVEDGTSVADGYNAWEDFGITSDYATEIPCFTFSGNSRFPDNQCYAIIQGTSLAASHVSAVLALTASKFPSLWHQPALLVAHLKSHAIHLSGNATTQASSTDTSNGDLNGTCPQGYCHLGSVVIPDAEAYGAGLVNAFGPFWPQLFLPLTVK